MKNLFLVLFFLCVSKLCMAQCVGEIKDIRQDINRGSIIVETEYTLNDKIVQTGRVRYLETNGTDAEIVAMIKVDIETHCKNIIQRIEDNRIFLQEEMLKKQKALTMPIVERIKIGLIGYKKSVEEVFEIYKGITIKVTYDKKNSVSNIIP